jgi:hypothetical protein
MFVKDLAELKTDTTISSSDKENLEECHLANRDYQRVACGILGLFGQDSFSQ